jgi:hypothetical protein
VDELDQAAADLDTSLLDDVIRRLQPLLPRLRGNLQDCQVVTHLPDGSTVSGTPTPAGGTAASSTTG